MSARMNTARAHRYLLGEASEEECALIEQEYLEHEEALDRMAEAEEDLIEDYLSGRLDGADRARFERVYLAAPAHRVRVETMRRLKALASEGSPLPASAAPALAWTRVRRYGPWLALAAVVVLVTALSVSRLTTPEPAAEVAQASPVPPPFESEAPATDVPPAPRTFALTLSSIAVRGDAASDPVVVPPATDVLVVHLEEEIDGPALVASRAVIQTVAGDEVWRGPVSDEDALPPGVAARVDVPATSIAADDYFVVLYGLDRAGVEREMTRYFLRVRTP